MGRVECLNSSHRTPVKTSRLWVTSTHYPWCCSHRRSTLPVSNLIHLFWTRASSLCPLLRIRSLLTSSLMIGPLCDPRGCFSTLFTAADHSAIKGIGGSLSAPLTPLQTLPSLTTAMPKCLQDDFFVAALRKTSNLVKLHSEDCCDID